MTNKAKTISLKIEEKMYNKLKELANKDRRNMSSYIRMILDKVISKEIKL